MKGSIYPLNNVAQKNMIQVSFVKNVDSQLNPNIIKKQAKNKKKLNLGLFTLLIYLVDR